MNLQNQRAAMLARLGCPPRVAQRIVDTPGRPRGRVEFRASSNEVELLLYDFIGYDWWTESGTSAASFAAELAALGRPSKLTIRINSPGGDVWDGMSIFNQISQLPYPTETAIDGLAASIASVIALATDRVTAAENSQFMIHDAWTMAVGSERDFIDLADVLAKIDQQIAETYAVRSGRSVKYFRDLQDRDTYLTAQEAFEMGLVDEVLGTRKPKAAARQTTHARVRRQMQLDRLAASASR